MKIKKLKENAIIPTQGTKYSAGYDLYSTETIKIKSNTTAKISTGLAMEIPTGYFGAIFPRSGMATKFGIRLANCVAVIDSDYRGEIIVPLHNDNKNDYHITEGERIAQIVFIPYKDIDFEIVDSLEDTVRGNGGFGSTGF